MTTQQTPDSAELRKRMQRYSSRLAKLDGRLDPYFLRELAQRLDMFRGVLLAAEKDTAQTAWERSLQ